MQPTTSEYVEVRKSKTHGLGVFAAKDIPKGTKIIEYVGERIDKKESDRRATVQLERAEEDPEAGAVYIFTLNKMWDIDGNVDWNTARLLNHSCSPNCETEIYDDHIWIQAIKDIPKGTELSYDYGYDVDNWDEHPCKCGSPNCIGYIVSKDQWPTLRKMLKRRKKRG